MEDKVQSIGRIFNIIETLATYPEGLGITQIAKECKLSKSTVHRLLSTLVERRYIIQDAETERYKIGYKFVEISGMYLDMIELRKESQFFLRSLTMRLIFYSHLAIPSGTDAMYVEKIQPVTYICMFSEIGKTIPMYCSALGKALLLDHSDDKLDKMFNGYDFVRYNDKTITSLEGLKENLSESRRRGFAFDIEEHEQGIFCIAAPVRNHMNKIIASISVSHYDRNIIVDNSETHDLILTTAKLISQRMGCIVDRN